MALWLYPVHGHGQDGGGESLSKKVGIKLWLRWTVITMTDENGRYFHQSKDSLVRALHVIVDEPDRELALVKLADALSMKSKAAIYGARFNFLPLLNHHTNSNMRQVCYKWRIRQATFLENMDTCTMKDIKDLMAEYKRTSLRGYLLSIKRDSHYTKPKDGPGVDRTLNRLFYSVDQGRDGVVYQFCHRDRNQAMRLLKSMYAFLRYSDRSPLKSASKDFIDKLFTQQSIALAAAGTWDNGKQDLLTWVNRYCEEMENVDDDDSDYEIDSAVAKRFEISFDVEIVDRKRHQHIGLSRDCLHIHPGSGSKEHQVRKKLQRHRCYSKRLDQLPQLCC
jgi:hypothetical protein